MSETIDLSALLAPIPGERATGEDLRYAGLHDAIREERRADDGLEAGAWKRSPKSADWSHVVSLGTSALAGRTKDLQVAAWVAEALVRRHGLPGLREGLELVEGLLRVYWDGLYPPAEDDLEARHNGLAWLDQQLALALRTVPLTETRAHTFGSWEAACATPRRGATGREDEEEQDDEEDDGTSARADAFRQAVAATSRHFYEDAIATARACREALQALRQTVDERFAGAGPSLRAVAGALEDIETVLARLLVEKPPPASSETISAGMAAVESRAGAPPTRDEDDGDPVVSRVEAVRRMRGVARYFRLAEPHSPVAYLVEKSVAWADMPLHAWLAQVVKDERVLERIQEELGLRAHGAD